MQQFLSNGYARSRMQETERLVTEAADRWTPPARGPAIRERIGRTLVVLGASLARDGGGMERLVAEQQPRAA